MEYLLKNCSINKLQMKISNLNKKKLKYFNFNTIKKSNSLANVSKKIITISGILFFYKYFLYNHNNNLKCYAFPQLLTFEPKEFSLKKCPKIIYMKKSLSDEDAKEILDNFDKIYSKYPDIQSYIIDFKNITSLNNLSEVLSEYGTSLEDILGEEEDLNIEKNFFEIRDKLISKKPFIFLNKYGDVRNYSLEEFNNISNDESLFTYFEKLTIMNNKNDLLMLNDYDFLIVNYINDKKLNYSEKNFRMFRKSYFSINFFNVKYFVGTPDQSKFLNLGEDNLNKIFLVKRKNMLAQIENPRVIKIDNEEFEIREIKVNPDTLNNEGIII